MGWLTKLLSKGAKKVVPKVLIGGSKEDRAAVKAVVNSGVADPVFDKFGKTAATALKIGGVLVTAGALAPVMAGTVALPAILGGGTGLTGLVTAGGIVATQAKKFLPKSSSVGLEQKILQDAGAASGTTGGGSVWLLIIGAILLFLFTKKSRGK